MDIPILSVLWGLGHKSKTKPYLLEAEISTGFRCTEEKPLFGSCAISKYGRCTWLPICLFIHACIVCRSVDKSMVNHRLVRALWGRENQRWVSWVRAQIGASPPERGFFCKLLVVNSGIFFSQSALCVFGLIRGWHTTGITCNLEYFIEKEKTWMVHSKVEYIGR